MAAAWGDINLPWLRLAASILYPHLARGGSPQCIFHLPDSLASASLASALTKLANKQQIDYPSLARSVENEILFAAMTVCDGYLRKAAELVNMPYDRFANRLRQHGKTFKDFRAQKHRRKKK